MTSVELGLRSLFCSILIAIMVLFPRPSFGQSVSHRIVVDESPFSMMGTTFVNLSSGDKLVASMEAGRSYCCFMMSGYREYGTALHGRFGDVTISSEGKESVLVTTERASSSPPLPDTNSRLCFIISSDKVRPEVSLEVLFGADNQQSAPYVFARCDETTLYGGFNTSVTDYNFLEITSTQNSTSTDTTAISGAITAKNVVNGQTVMDNRAFSVSPESRTDINIHEAAGVGFGPIRIVHDGPPGGISATLVQYNITTAPSFAPVAQTVFKTRNQLRGGR